MATTEASHIEGYSIDPELGHLRLTTDKGEVVVVYRRQFDTIVDDMRREDERREHHGAARAALLRVAILLLASHMSDVHPDFVKDHGVPVNPTAGAERTR